MIGRKKELSFLENGLNSRGTLRVAFVSGMPGIGKSYLFEELAKRLANQNPHHLLVVINGGEVKDFHSLLSALARNLIPGSEISPKELHDCGRNLGTAIVDIENQLRGGLEPKEFRQKLATTYIDLIENALSASHVAPIAFTPILIFEDLELIPEPLKDWLANDFNQALRKSKFFQNTRFLLSSEKSMAHFEAFFASFGFSKPQEIQLFPLNESECIKLAQSKGITIIEGKFLKKQSGGIPSKLLKLLNNSSNLTSNGNLKMSESQKKNTIHPDAFSEKELSHLLFASYPTRINRYNLEFFCSPKEAAFSFNWLKRKPNIARNAGDGDLFLDEDLRRQMREFHKQEEPEEADRMDVLASVLDAFIELFPDPNSHWIPMSLQLFNSFSKELCGKIFSEVENEEILAFLETHAEQFERSGKFYRMNEESKLVTKRFIEVSEAQLDEELPEKIKRQWDLDQDKASEKKSKMELEQQNFQVEIGDIESQINSLASVKENLMQDFKNPAQNKPKKIYSFSSSSLLIVLGLGTIGASLFSDLIGSYHAACGIALTLFGFFWPSVEVKKPKVANVGAGPKLAIETQHRSMDHRIKGLANRANFINSSLEQLSKDIEGVNQGMNEPYLLNE